MLGAMPAEADPRSPSALVERARRAHGERFDALLGQLLTGTDPDVWVAELAHSISGFRQVLIAADVGRHRIKACIPLLREFTAATGPGSVDLRCAALYALQRCAPEVEFLDDALRLAAARDPRTAEMASVLVEHLTDSALAEPLRVWLIDALGRARSPHRQKIVGNLMATCIRLGGAESHAELRRACEGQRLGEVERRALAGTWRGHMRSGEYPFISWPGDV